ncbi:ubinuclein-2a isoform X2 [Clupea harengus]|uniref:Ubinuclein-2a isoform X2 n=1 Tax=Clupea harengus TaxID=7950 RepID=A0A8M1KE14_CLUHA|nr:ubinuclein-2a isoform X2 [Clupea harengus]
MAEPRKVQFVTLSAFAAGPATEPRKRRLDDEADKNFDGDGGIGTSTTGAIGDGGLFGKTGDRDSVEPKRVTVRLNLSLTEPNDQSSAEFNYSELIQSLQKPQKPKPTPTPAPTPALDPNDPFNDDEKDRQQVEALAKKFENKYGNSGKKKRKDRMQDLIDIGFGYDESDPFIDNSEAYDELVPASLSTKLGGFYINTGTLQFRAASESEGEDGGKVGTAVDGGVQMIKKRKRKEGTLLEEKKPRKNRVPKQGTALTLHRPEKKKRKKLMKDSLYLAAMLRRFTREKEELRNPNQTATPHLVLANAAHANHMLHNSSLPGNSSATAGTNDVSLADLTADPAMMSLLNSANESELQDLLGDLDFSLLDPPTMMASPGRENGLMGVGASPGQKAGGQGRGQGGLGVGGGLLSPPPLPVGLPAPLIKRIEDLRAASRQFDQEGRKKFFTLDMNNILLDIELQVQEQPAEARSAIYSHMEAFVPCNKEALLKRLKKLSLNIQDDRLRTPLLKLKLAVCSVMPEQIARYNMDCVAKAAAKQQSEEGEKNGSEEEDEEKPGKRVMGPRKKFIWDDKLRTLLCNLVRVKLSCYEAEPQGSPSVEEYLKAFMENEVKPLWPKGWMQARMLFKESRIVHGHLTGLGKKRMVPGPKAIKAKEGVWIPRPGLVGVSPAPPATPVIRRPPTSPSEPICLSDSLDEDLATNSLDSISQALALLSNAAKGLTQTNGPPTSSPVSMASSTAGILVGHYASPLSHSVTSKLDSPVMSLANMSTLSTSPSLSSSPSLCRPMTITSSPSAASRAEAYGMLKDAGLLSQAQRLAMTPTHRSGAGLNSPSPPKPRPPPTASPLLPPQQKSFCPPGMKPGQATPPSGMAKSSANKLSGGNGGMGGGSPLARVNSHPSQLNAKSPQQPQRLPGSPSPVPSSSPIIISHPQSKAQHQHPQSNFITPMQATLTKSSHSSSSPIIKLTPRPPAPTPPPSSSSSPSPSSSPSLPLSRPQMMVNSHQYSAKGAGFRPPFTTQGGSSVKPGQGSYSYPGGQKPSAPLGGGGGNTNPGPIGTPPSVSSHQDIISSPSVISVNHGQRQRAVGGAGQSAKAVTSRASASTMTSTMTSQSVSSHLSQVSSAAAANLLSSVPSLPLGFGMLGGLVPVSLPFQFPQLLNFAPPTAPGSMGSSPGANSGYTLAQNLFKSLQSGSQAALPPHLQLAFSDTNQSQGGDMKRKTH